MKYKDLNSGILIQATMINGIDANRPLNAISRACTYKSRVTSGVPPVPEICKPSDEQGRFPRYNEHRPLVFADVIGPSRPIAEYEAMLKQAGKDDSPARHIDILI